jgi:hypothetical protein
MVSSPSRYCKIACSLRAQVSHLVAGIWRWRQFPNKLQAYPSVYAKSMLENLEPKSV